MKNNYSILVNDIAALIEQGRKTAARYINTTLFVTYWMVGRRIVEFEQKGEHRAGYGQGLLKKIAKDLAPQFGRGFVERNLEYMRQFYIVYPEKSNTLCSDSMGKGNNKANTTCSQLPLQSCNMQEFILSWSHYRLLMRLGEDDKRKFYEVECVTGNWSVRQLDRQIQSMLYDRVSLSKRKQTVIEKANAKPITLKPEDEIKDPYVLEFLGLKDEYSESQLEEALIKYLEHFLLEMGVGFTFVARQKRITLEGSHYRLDLLLYHRVLKCLVAIDLKIGEFTHADAGQMNLYVNYLKHKEKLADENDPIGIILCTDKKKTVAEYALGGMNNKIFASQYRLKLPDVKVLQKKIETEKNRLLESKPLG